MQSTFGHHVFKMSYFIVGLVAVAFFLQTVNTAPVEDTKTQDNIGLKNRILHFHQPIPAATVIQEQSYVTPTYEEQSYIIPSYQEQSYVLPGYQEPTYVLPSYEAPTCAVPSYQQAVYQPAYQQPTYQYQYYAQNCDGYRDASDICTPYGIIHTGTDLSSHVSPAPVVPEVTSAYGYSGAVPGVINGYPSAYTGSTYTPGPTYLNLPKSTTRSSY